MLKEKNILIVDNDEITAEAISGLLKHLGARAIISLDEASAFGELDEFYYDVAIINYTMPQKDGIKIIDEIKHQPGFKPLTILMSSLVDEEITNKAHTAGADFILEKPFGIEELKKVLEIIQKRQLLSDKTVHSEKSPPLG